MKFDKESFYQFWRKSWLISFLIFLVSFFIFVYFTYYVLNIFYPLAFCLSAFIANLNVVYFQNFRQWHSFGLILNRYAIKHLLLGFGFPLLFILPLLLFLIPFGIELQKVDMEKVLSSGLFLLLSATFEELLFRGVLFQKLIERKGEIVSIFSSSLVFALLHSFNPSYSFVAFINIFLAGVLLAVMFVRTYMLWLSIGFHFGWNFWQAFLLASPVSGLNFEIGLFNTKITMFNEILFGGSFGIEGGICSTVILGIAIWVVAKNFVPVPEVYSRVLRERFSP
jgi:membrane protease YdiL (CAAX protease family)